MSKPVLYIAVIFSAVNSATGQSFFGGYIEINGGIAGNFSPSLQRDLRAETLLGTGLNFNRVGPLLGGSAQLFVSDRLLFGFSISGYRVSGQTPRGSSDLFVVGGFANAGYLLWHSSHIMSYPYVGVGASMMSFEVTNSLQADSMRIGLHTIRPGASARFTSPGIALEAGYAFKFLTSSLWSRTDSKGPVFGVQVGAFVFAGIRDWRRRTAGEAVSTIAQALSFAPYVRVTAGFGHFRRSAGHNRWGSGHQNPLVR